MPTYSQKTRLNGALSERGARRIAASDGEADDTRGNEKQRRGLWNHLSSVMSSETSPATLFPELSVYRTLILAASAAVNNVPVGIVRSKT